MNSARARFSAISSRCPKPVTTILQPVGERVARRRVGEPAPVLVRPREDALQRGVEVAALLTEPVGVDLPVRKKMHAGAIPRVGCRRGKR
jgi:hypothetical protein